jgi:putative transposase
LHKLSKAILDENQVVVVEDINVKGLLQSNLAKSISDSSIAGIRQSGMGELLFK